MDPQEERLKTGTDPWAGEDESHDGIVSTADRKWRVPSERGDYRKFYENIRDTIAGTAPLAVNPREAAAVIQILERARKNSFASRNDVSSM
jgi:scyllo-inositol 2-dehydrogenase (NADP+)